MLLPDINKRAERTLKSTLSRTHMSSFPSLLAFIMTKTKLCRYYQRSERGCACITLSATGSMPTPGHGRGENRGRGVKRVEADWLYPWKRQHFLLPGVIQAVCPCLVPGSSVLACQPVSCERVCEEQTDLCSTTVKQKNQQRTGNHVAHIGSKSFM